MVYKVSTMSIYYYKSEIINLNKKIIWIKSKNKAKSFKKT